MSLFPNLIATKGMHGDEAYLIYTGEINSSEGEKIELLTNNEINKDIPIVCEYTDYDTLQKESRFVPSNLPRDKKLRKLKIGNYPTMADGGVQVKSTIEIGKIKITSINYSDGKSKIDYQVI
jgi:Ser-tRNA(Ala) deacylase AlaX